MAAIIFIQPDGTRQSVQGVVGKSVMEAAVRHNVPGIDAECGGSCSCGTCHVHVRDEWSGRLPPKSADEEATLDCAFGVLHDSRLSCQIVFREELDGLVVHL
ncbi:2Fe-2S iron-sulfur cluster binding domain-containing protein [Duganella sp. FT80W]|uniref:2Fe-2S iron-sulfur cluster binding domain-containing protein n=1 Tax=Duganella guangzhouensis TaxID=2666084 RepID=A0A6I2L154_9BURK|nr:2Fe-2S iron-sulfur cluster-binding protein [Duganella guangzhouensis]MRW91460.1 2Fe-2S iron-sulfur cluster binding domain-containing protein [Duganella guangzhouensis]